jgi:adenylate cyclase
MKRRLAAILAADVAGYSRLMARDEAAAFAALRSHLEEHVKPSIASHGGRVVKLMGDGLLAEFQSLTDAVFAAVAIQQGMMERNQNASESDALVFRIGINIGELIIEGDDLYGDGLNVAVRLQEFAEPGKICLSGDAFRQIKSKSGLEFSDLGEHALKNLPEPVRIYQLAAATGPAAPAPQHPELPDRAAIAVLPFENIGDDPEQEYFSDGLTDDILTALTAWRSFPVIARNSCFVYKHRAVHVQQVGRELGARYLLEGGVRRSGTQLRVNAQLVDATTGHHLWADRFDRKLDDVFALQDEISRRIAAIIEPTLSRAELQRSTAKPVGSLQAWDFYLRGISYLHLFTKDGTAKARDMFLAAAALDRTYSRAYAGLAWGYSRDLLLGFSENPEQSKSKLFEAARKAVELDPLSSLAHHLLSTAHIWRNEHELAIAEGRLAVELNPSDAEALHALGNKLDLFGDPEGILRMEQAQQLNPQDPQQHMYLSFLARAYAAAGSYEAALASARKAIQRRSDYPHAYYVQAIALAHLGRCAEARATLQECEHLHPGFVQARRDWKPYANPEPNARLAEGVRRAELSR